MFTKEMVGEIDKIWHICCDELASKMSDEFENSVKINSTSLRITFIIFSFCVITLLCLFCIFKLFINVKILIISVYMYILKVDGTGLKV